MTRLAQPEHSRRSRLARLAVTAALGLGTAGNGPLALPPGAAALVRPPHGRTVAAGTALQSVLDGASAGSVFYLAPGIYPGPVRVRTSVTIWGPPEAVIRSGGTGTTVAVRADHVALLGFTVDGSGQRYDKMDAAVYVRGVDVRVEGLTVRNALFGLVAEESRGLTLSGNHIVGDRATPVGIRGDAIRLWEVRDSVVAANRIEDARDIVVWYSPGNRITDNAVRNGRYATHFMYSSDSVVDGNRYVGNIVGVFIMYSRNVAVRGNLLAGNTAADGMGLGVKESGNLTLEDNRFVNDRQGLYLDTSPFRKGDADVFRRNLFAWCDTGVTFHSSETANAFADNAFEDNRAQVVVEGRGNALGVTWRGNYFDDYRGYDFDHDGYGDVPYELRSLSGRLTSTYPDLAFFRGTAALALVDVVGEVFPLWQPQTLLVDPHPRMHPPGH